VPDRRPESDYENLDSTTKGESLYRIPVPAVHFQKASLCCGGGRQGNQEIIEPN